MLFAVSGKKSTKNLNYWNLELQEAYFFMQG